MSATNTLIYKPIKQKYAEYASDYSEVTDKLIKRKRIYLFTFATAQEWLDLANDFSADGGRANAAFCMAEYRKCGGVAVNLAEVGLSDLQPSSPQINKLENAPETLGVAYPTLLSAQGRLEAIRGMSDAQRYGWQDEGDA